MKEQIYMNAETGEITFDHKEAVEWYNEGNEIIIYVDKKEKVRWVH